jgi:hypothetical protein
MKFFSIIITVFIFTIALQQTAWAQKLIPDAPVAEEEIDATALFAQLPPEIQEEIIDESEMVYKSCETSPTKSAYNDCQCLAAAYMDKRTITGPEVPQFRIIAEIKDLCKNEEGYAGNLFKGCINNMAHYDPIEVEEYCTCFANSGAKFYNESKGYVPAKTLTSHAVRECRSLRPD